MKKLIGIIIASSLAILSLGASAVTAHAAGEYKNAAYEGGVYANNKDHALAIFFYKNGKQELVYLNDGTNYGYSEYTMTEAQVPGFGAGAKLTVGDLVLYSFDYDGNEYVMTGDGELFLAQDINSYEAQQIRDAF